jgi:SAM-dependent methyltransferase
MQRDNEVEAIAQRNRAAWARLVATGDRWTVPVSSDVIAAARRGDWQLLLTPTRAVPRAWFGALAGREVLCLASGGGQQGPVLAAAGARVTVLDASPEQLAQDARVAERDGLELRLEEGLMQDLSRFGAGSFDLVFHPVSNCFVPDVRPVWRECHRVLRAGGELLAGFANPVLYIFDEEADNRGEVIVRHRIPYSDLELPPDELARRLERDPTINFGHSLEHQLGGQIDAGFALIGFYEDILPGTGSSEHLPTFIATRARKA